MFDMLQLVDMMALHIRCDLMNLPHHDDKLKRIEHGS
jgi:hypothetical protein